MAVVTLKKPAAPVPASKMPMARFKYGAWWKPVFYQGKPLYPKQDWEIERDCYLRCTEEKHPPGWMGKAEHFRRMVSIIWASGVAKRPFLWNPNAVRIIDKYFEHDFLSCAGHASSGKSEVLAIIAVAEFIADPENTAVLVTSTTLSESRGRIWGRIEFYWQECIDYFNALGAQMGVKIDPPGALISSSGMIRYKLGDKKDDTRGIKLVPGKESEVKEGVGRMKGFKARRLRFLVDEMSDLSHKLLEGAETNLYVNPDFKMVASFNPASHFDPAGVFSEPENGWASVNILESDGWKTKRGWCIRFDGNTSPNVVARMERWPGLLTHEKLEGAKKNPEIGENSPAFYQMFRGAWSEVGNADGIYSEAEIIKYLAQKKAEIWESPAVMVGGFDPAFSHGGDRAVLVTAKTGKATCFGVFKSCIDFEQIIFLDENIDTKQDKKEFIIARLKEACQKHGLDPKNLAMDATGGGDVLATLMARDEFFANKFMRVQFGGEASELTMGGKKGKDRFVDMVSELWYAGKPLLRCGQIKGLKPDMIREMTLRLYTEQTGGKKKIKVEPKEDMKARLKGRSPDISDSAFLSLFVARSRHGLKSDEVVAKPKQQLEKGPLDSQFSWGLKKKPRINEPEYVHATGSGWGDDNSGFGGMFG